MRRLLFGDDLKPDHPDRIEPEECVLNLPLVISSRSETSFSAFGRLLFPQSLSFGYFSNQRDFEEETGNPGEDRSVDASPGVPSSGIIPVDPPVLLTVEVLSKRSPVPSLIIPGLAKVSVATDTLIPETRATARELQEPPSSKEFRRVCSEIVVGQLFVSGWLVAEDWSQLESLGITHVINTASSISKCPFAAVISYLPLAIEDSKNEDIEAYFYPCIDFIEEAVRNGGRVLVHCMEGVSRSCSIAIAYIMWKHGIGYQEAQAFVQSRRPICQPNAGFICQLLAFQTRQADDVELRRVTLRKFNDKFVLVACKCLTDPCDPRFSYVRRKSDRFEILASPDCTNADFHLQLARDAIDRTCRIEDVYPEVVEAGWFHEHQVASNSSFDSDFNACTEFLELGSSSDQLLEEPCTARSRRSHGSIDSARDSRGVKVYLLKLPMHRLEPPIPYFDSDDLDSRCLYLFESRSDVVVWIGDEATDIDQESICDLVISLMKQEGRSVDDVQLVAQGTEPDPFWDLFQDG